MGALQPRPKPLEKMGLMEYQPVEMGDMSLADLPLASGAPASDGPVADLSGFDRSNYYGGPDEEINSKMEFAQRLPSQDDSLLEILTSSGEEPPTLPKGYTPLGVSQDPDTGEARWQYIRVDEASTDWLGQPLNGPSNFDRLDATAQLLSEGRYSDAANAFFLYTVPDAEQRLAAFGAPPSSEAQRLAMVTSSPIGGSLFGIANMLGASESTQNLLLGLGAATEGVALSFSPRFSLTPSFTGAQGIANPSATRPNVSGLLPHLAAENKGFVGIEITPNGGPTFANSPYLYPVGPGQRNVVDIPLTGSRRDDFAAANRAAGLQGVVPSGRDAPANYVWHHVDNLNMVTGRATLELTLGVPSACPPSHFLADASRFLMA